MYYFKFRFRFINRIVPALKPSLRFPWSSLNRELKEQDKSSDIEQQPPFGDRKISNIQPQNRAGGLQNQQEHHIILTKYEAVHPTVVSENIQLDNDRFYNTNMYIQLIMVKDKVVHFIPLETDAIFVSS